MILVHNFHLLNFTLKLSILSNHIEYPKKISAILRTTLFYSFCDIFSEHK